MLNPNSIAAVVDTSPLAHSTLSSNKLLSSSSPSSSSTAAATATTSSATLSPITPTVTQSDSDYAKVGLSMWLNNAPDRAEQHFRAKLQSTPIFAGYAFTVSMNGVIAYEMDKIEAAQLLLKELERRCTYSGSTGWLSSVRSRLFSGTPTTPKSSSSNAQARLIEEQIILADTFLSTAILTFLTQDITGLMRGSWLLRKAWKIYQSTYVQLFEMFIHHFGDHTNVPPMPSNYQKPMPRSKSEYNYSTSASCTLNNDITEAFLHAPSPKPPTGTAYSASSEALAHPTPQLYNTNQSLHSQIANNTIAQRQHPIYATTTNHQPLQTHTEALHCDQSTNDSTPHGSTMRPTHLPLGFDCHSTHLYVSSLNNPKCAALPQPQLQTCPVEPSEAFNRLTQNRQCHQTEASGMPSESCIDEESISRLMGAVSFGYGIFQLSASLLPLSLLRIISFFGFEGNRTMGVACLMFARLSDDMRAPLATLALLWFYTFGSQMLKYEDGYTTNQARDAAQLIAESERRYPNSSIFLFFRGRVERMKANTLAAVRAYQQAHRYSAQKELRLLCLHEIAWCKLIQLDFENAQHRFNELREVSIFSKAFYTYMTAICQGASGRYGNLCESRCEMQRLLAISKQKDSHISAFVQHRLRLFPAADEPPNARPAHNQYFWKYLVYEVLFLWSALCNASTVELTCIVADCSAPSGKYIEPMIGVQQLILGGVLACLKQYQAAVNAYRCCLTQRLTSNSKDDFHHIAAFANYELAMLLLQCSVDCSQESRQLLRDALLLKGYDLENRLVVHVQKELKKLG